MGILRGKLFDSFERAIVHLPVTGARLGRSAVGVDGLANVKSSSAASTKNGVDVERGSMLESSACISNAKLECDVP